MEKMSEELKTAMRNKAKREEKFDLERQPRDISDMVDRIDMELRRRTAAASGTESQSNIKRKSKAAAAPKLDVLTGIESQRKIKEEPLDMEVQLNTESQQKIKEEAPEMEDQPEVENQPQVENPPIVKEEPTDMEGQPKANIAELKEGGEIGDYTTLIENTVFGWGEDCGYHFPIKVGCCKKHARISFNRTGRAFLEPVEGLLFINGKWCTEKTPINHLDILQFFRTRLIFSYPFNSRFFSVVGKYEPGEENKPPRSHTNLFPNMEEILSRLSTVPTVTPEEVAEIIKKNKAKEQEEPRKMTLRSAKKNKNGKKGGNNPKPRKSGHLVQYAEKRIREADSTTGRALSFEKYRPSPSGASASGASASDASTSGACASTSASDPDFYERSQQELIEAFKRNEPEFTKLCVTKAVDCLQNIMTDLKGVYNVMKENEKHVLPALRFSQQYKELLETGKQSRRNVKKLYKKFESRKKEIEELTKQDLR